jgi:hypothetical protein
MSKHIDVLPYRDFYPFGQDTIEWMERTKEYILSEKCDNKYYDRMASLWKLYLFSKGEIGMYTLVNKRNSK